MTPWIRRVAVCGVLGCVAPWAWASDADNPATLPAGQGVVAGTLVLDFQGSAPEMQGALFVATTMTLTIRRVDGPDSSDIRFTLTPTGWNTPGMTRITSTDRRLLFFRGLPPGTYEITERSASALNRKVDFFGDGKSPRFTVAAGTITYIGAEVLKAHGHKDLLGANTFDGATIVIDDDVDDDARQLYHARPDLRALPIADAVSGALLPAPGMAARAEDGGVKGDISLRDVAAVKASAGIAPAVFAKLEAFHPSTPPRARGTLLRVVEHRAFTIDGKPGGGNTRTLEFLADAPGYVFDSMDASTGPIQILEYLPFVQVQSRLTKHTQVKFGFDKDTTSITRLSDVRLPDFDTALTPGANWMIESESDMSIHAQNAIRSIDRANFSIIKRQCSTSERQPASTLSPDLAGTMLTVVCHQVDQPGDELSMAYLEDYGVFVLLRQSVSIAPKGTRIVNDYSVVRVELSGQVAPAAPAQPATAAPLPSFEESMAAFNRHDYATALVDFTALAERGDPHAQWTLATMYYQGLGTPKNGQMVVKWARKAADQGSVLAQLGLGAVYQAGTLVPEDRQAAFGWFLEAAQQGNAEAQAIVGGNYVDGIGVAKDPKAALEWNRKSAAQGSAQGEANLGVMYYNGEGVAQDVGQAAAWTRKSAEQGNIAGEAQLCVLYARGNGVPMDNEQAYFWCLLASAQGHANATTNLRGIQVALTDTQRARIQASAQAWRPK